MLFNSFEYSILFLPITALIYFIFKKVNLNLSKIWVCAISVYFYSFFTYQFIPLLIASMAINFIIIKLILSHGDNKYIVSSVLFNVVSLGYFKYCNFFASNIDSIFGLAIGHLDVVAPLAISFYTFQQISLSVSAHRKQITEVTLLDYCAYILFFPKLISGPITNYEIITNQLSSRDSYLGKYLAPGLFVFSVGVFKKIVLASYFGAIADQGYSVVSTLNTLDSWITSLSYTLQLYFDFSGYTDMAIGSGLLFGVLLPLNFNSPYLATDLQDFWRRWHITLSTWLRNYVYIPLGGNRKGVPRTYLNLFLTFLIGGFWHGAGWNFLAWGALHGAGLVVHRYWSQNGLRMPSILGWFVTFNYVNIAWIFFRTENITDAVTILKKMFGMVSGTAEPVKFNQIFSDSFSFIFPDLNVQMWLVCAAAIAICLVPFNTNSIISMVNSDRKGVIWNAVIPAASALALCVAVYASLGGGSAGSFIYFNF
ncbi:MBOAT family O-acyltransferase [Yokenella regensburgei]|uniref:MBOAT family O-acyltransferase n=1 Tax=Yokenella regensburgei TaxID=158877 RepID=UPI0014329BB1|nr:MBOAT family protein [Yokenella regensburgei]QIU89375.1 MBOAT family protein [Yokenella regensburgei]